MTIYDQRGQQVDRQYNAGGDIIFNPPPQPDAQHQRNRQRLLAKVRAFWIKDVLENSLHNAALMDLGFVYQPEAVQHPWAVVVQQPDQPSHVLPPGTKIHAVFQAKQGELLILGEPGAGKTTLLLELARDLLDSVEQDEAQPMPVVFNLSSWAEQCRPINEWLVNELNERYDVPRRIGQAWINADQVLPLLDGLDEVEQDHRATCVAAINAFRQDHGLGGLAVCCRHDDYEMLQIQLKLMGAVLIQPLTQVQIDAYLASAGNQLTVLRATLHQDTALQELAQSPLHLSIMTLAYRDLAPGALPTGTTVEEQRKHLFTTYVNGMFQRRSIDKRYAHEQTLHWLCWLAQAMSRQGQSIFLLERLQPNWLSTRTARWQYNLVDRLSSGLLIGVVFGLVVGVVFGLQDGLVLGLLGGLFSSLFGGNSDAYTPTQQRITSLLVNTLQGSLLFGLLFGLFVGLQNGLQDGLFLGLAFGLLGGQVGALAGRPNVHPRRIIIVEALHWSWSRAWRLALSGLVFGVFFGLVIGLLYGETYVDGLLASLLLGLGFGLVFGLVFGLLGGLLGGLQGSEVETRVRPNQGVWRSARRALQVGLLVALSYGLLVGLLVGLQNGLQDGLFLGLVFGLVVGQAGALTYGGYAVLSHVALRFVLWRRGYLPWHLVRFLDYCTERIFLRKGGGGYIFAHRLLLEYFANQYTEPETHPVPASASQRALPLLPSGKGTWRYPRWRRGGVIGLVLLLIMLGIGVGYYLYAQPLDAQAYTNRGLAYYHKGDYERAIADATKAIELKHDPLSLPYLNRGVAYQAKGDYERAIADYNQTLQLQPDYAQAYTNRGLAYYHKGDYERAIADATKAIELKHDPLSWPYLNRGVAYQAKGDYERAIADATKAIELKHDPLSLPYLNRGVAYQAKGDYERAIADYDQTLQLQPDYAQAYTNRGLAYYHKGDYEQAMRDYIKATEINPDNPDNWNRLCWTGSLWGQATNVMAACEQAVALQPNDGNVHDSRALARALTGNYTGALEDFRTFVEWSKANAMYESHGRKREAWIAELEAGRNPFNAATLEDLRNE